MGLRQGGFANLIVEPKVAQRSNGRSRVLNLVITYQIGAR
jgi:hypothetical protein